MNCEGCEFTMALILAPAFGAKATRPASGNVGLVEVFTIFTSWILVESKSSI